MRRFFMTLIALFAVVVIFNPSPVFATTVIKKVVVIDAGHGGWDPGKIGKNDTLEKDINLAIAEDLQALLELGGATVFLTRADDNALADRKNADLTARANMPTDMKADIFISIHQNSFGNAGVSGAQAFYYDGSEESQRLAEAVQGRIRGWLDTENRKEAKADSSYFLLKKTQTPAVIVECGFLTNEGDALKLVQENYQERVAWAVYLGVLDYFEKPPVKTG